MSCQSGRDHGNDSVFDNRRL